MGASGSGEWKERSGSRVKERRKRGNRSCHFRSLEGGGYPIAPKSGALAKKKQKGNVERLSEEPVVILAGCPKESNPK